MRVMRRAGSIAVGLVMVGTSIGMAARPVATAATTCGPTGGDAHGQCQVIALAPTLPFPSWWAGQACDANSNPVHNLLASWGNLEACGPEDPNGNNDHQVSFGGSKYYVGEWECTELVERYLFLRYGIPTLKADGSQVVDAAWAYLQKHYGLAPELRRVYPTNHQLPTPGDVMSESSSAGPHTNLVIGISPVDSSGTGWYTTLNQNWENGQIGSAIQTFPIRNFQPLYYGKPVIDWLHNTGAAQICSSDDALGNSASLVPVCQPPWWNGMCDSGIHPGAEMLDSWLGLIACGPPNNDSTITESAPLYPNLEWQCVELVERWLYEEFGLPVQAPQGSDADGWQVVNDYWQYITTAYPGTAPLVEYLPSTAIAGDIGPGDVVSYGKTDPGHTNVVISVNVNSVGNGTMISLNQNYGGKGEVTQTVKHWVPGPVYTKGGVPIVATGWLHYTPKSRAADEPQLPTISCTSASDCMAVGWRVQGDYGPLAEQWSHAAWHVVPTQDPPKPFHSGSLDDVSCIASNNCTAVGDWNSPNGDANWALIEHWNGTKWTIVHTPQSSNWTYSALSAVSCATATFCVALGSYFTDSTFSEPLVLVEQWNGTKWSLVPSPTPAAANGFSILDVSCTRALRCMAVGYTDDQSGYENLSDWWNGKTWRVPPMATPSDGNPDLSDVSCTGISTCIAVGGSQFAQLWNGNTWSQLPASAGALTSVSCLGINSCMAVGPPDFEHWNGTKWSPLPYPTWWLGANAFEIIDLSCTSVSTCMSVGPDGTKARWDGIDWASVPG